MLPSPSPARKPMNARPEKVTQGAPTRGRFFDSVTPLMVHTKMPIYARHNIWVTLHRTMENTGEV